MEAQLKVTHLQQSYKDKLQNLISTLEADAECEGDNKCTCMNCRIGAGRFEVIDDENLFYTTGSGKGQYWFSGQGIIFKGWRNSFMDGTEFFHPADFLPFGDWKVTKSSQMWRDPFEEIEERV